MAAAKKTKINLPKTVYICTPLTEDMEHLPATQDIESYGFSGDEVWGEYQLVRKVRPRSIFHLEEV